VVRVTCRLTWSWTAVALNLAIFSPTPAGHLTVFPTNGVARLASRISYVAGQTAANVATT
jgi:hypothetical protein